MPQAKVLVTGGAGYLGSVLVKRLLERGFHVTVLDQFLYRQQSLFGLCGNPNFEVIRGDSRDETLMAQVLKGKDVLIPLAAIVGAPACDRDPVAADSTNVGAIRLLVKLSSRSQKVLFPTTNSGYGIGEKNKFCTEETPLKPISLYGKNKAQAETIILERGNSISFRLATVFGVSPRMRMDLLVNHFTYKAVTERALVLFEGHFKRNYIHIQDVANAFLYGIENFERVKDQAYNVGLEDANLSKIELCQKIKQFVPEFVFMEAPIGKDIDQRDYIVSNKKILATGFKPDKTLEDGIRELIQCYAMLRLGAYGNV